MQGELKNWWTLYRDPTLDHLVDLAAKQNLTLLEAGTRVLAARATLGIAIGDFYPQRQQLDGNTLYNQASKVDAASNPTYSLGDYWRASLGAQIAWELDVWGKFRRGVESADAAYLSTVAGYDSVLVGLLGDVATTYVGIRTLQAQLIIANDNIVKQQRALRIARDRQAGGTATGLDVAQAENVLAQTQAELPRLTAELDKARAAMCVLLGIPPQSLDTLLAGKPAVPVPPENVVVGMPADLLRRRPDVRQAELAAAAQSAQIGIARADLFPAFVLNGVFGVSAATTSGKSLSDLFTSNAVTFAFGPSFSWPILNYGQITNNVRVQDAKLQGLLVSYQNTVLQAQREVESGLAAYVQGRQQVALLRKSVAAASRALQIATDQYLLGTRDFTTVLTAEQNLYAAQSNLATAEGNYAASLATIYRALGGGWELRQDGDFVDDATRAQMRARTGWGTLLPEDGKISPTPPGLPGPADMGANVRAPEW